MPPLEDLVAEADRQFHVCNACRYCEGYCPVFPAMALRDSFAAGDVSYLANVCHDCRACYQACMYTEPHEFAINIPALMSEARVRSYRRYVRPRWLGRAFERGGVTLAVVTVAAVVLIIGAYELLGSMVALTGTTRPPGDFYAVVSHTAMLVPALFLSVFGLAVAGVGLVAFWRDTGGFSRGITLRIAWTAVREAATLRWLDGGGGDCFYPEREDATPVRARLHHCVAYGFMAALAATISAWIAETFFHDLPPYPILSVPVLLGIIGGTGMIVGCTGLIALKTRASRDLKASREMKLDVSFLIALLVVAATGGALLALRKSPAMGVLLLVHLAMVGVLYLTAPYGKFMHAIYRGGALLRSAYERAGGSRTDGNATAGEANEGDGPVLSPMTS